jgi:hypothetical protein
MFKPISFAFVSFVFYATSGCTTAECTDDLRSYHVAVVRSTPVATQPTSVEVCVSSRCKTYSVEREALAAGPDLDEVASGTVKRDAGGILQLALKVRIDEAAAGTAVRLRVSLRDSTNASLLDVNGDVPFTDEECHPTPKVASL